MNLSIKFDSYKEILNTLRTQLDYMNTLVDEFNNNPSAIDINLSDKLVEFKKNIDLSDIKEEPINISNINELDSSIHMYNSQLNKLINDFSKLKDKIAYGGNLYRAISNKPKVYHPEEDEEAYYKINNNIHQINYMIDWIEKGLLDLSSVVSQDLVVLNIINRVYKRRKIYESNQIEKVLSEL